MADYSVFARFINNNCRKIAEMAFLANGKFSFLFFSFWLRTSFGQGVQGGITDPFGPREGIAGNNIFASGG